MYLYVTFIDMRIINSYSHTCIIWKQRRAEPLQYTHRYDIFMLIIKSHSYTCIIWTYMDTAPCPWTTPIYLSIRYICVYISNSYSHTCVIWLYANSAVPLNHSSPNTGPQKKKIDDKVPLSCSVEIGDTLDAPVHACRRSSQGECPLLCVCVCVYIYIYIYIYIL